MGKSEKVKKAKTQNQKTLEIKRNKIKSTIGKKKKKDLNKDKFVEERNFEHEIDDDEIDYDEEIENPNVQKYENDEQENNDSCESDLDPEEHMKSLKKLKDIDPEFYEYLEKNDNNLLDFNVSDNEDYDFSKNGDDDDDDRHIPDENLEVASDASDYEPENEEPKDSAKKKITLQLLKTWQKEIQTDISATTIRHAIDAFHAALNSVAVSSDDSTVYKVEGSAIFNGVMELCIMYLPDALSRFLKLDAKCPEPYKSKRFTKVRGILKLYLTDLLNLLQNVTSSNILTVLLKHLRQMLLYTQSFSSLTKPLLKILLKLWSTGEKTVRIISFLNILRIATSYKEFILEKLLKTMYVKYVQNAKFMSPDSLAEINFMRHSLVEIYLFNHNLSYSHAFLYIRQLAIHLRNAVTLKKKENFQVVYNWQYINSLRFWVDLVNKTKPNSMLRSLIYPLIQIIIGTIKMIPTAQYFPLRFHCIQMLINISNEINIYIPVLPFLLEPLEIFDFNKKFKGNGLKPIPLICILRLSKIQLDDAACRSNIIETIYQFILEYAANESNKMYFPELYIPCIIRLKAFLKKCHIAIHCRKMKQLLNLIEENRKFILNKRSAINLELHNMATIVECENSIKVEGTAISKFYASWIKIHEAQKLRLLNKKEEEITIPVMKKSEKRKLEDKDKDTDSEEESEFEFFVKGTKNVEEQAKESSKDETKSKKIKQKKKKRNTTNNNTEKLQEEIPDIVQDTKSSDWD